MASKQRWHDYSPQLTQAIQFLGSLPEDLQTSIGDCVIQVAEKRFLVSELVNNLKSMGGERVLGLHKSHQKRRGYDKNPTMYKAVNTIYLMPENEQVQIASHVLELRECVVQYFEVHKTYQVAAQLDMLNQMVRAYLSGGQKAAMEVVNTVRQQLYEDVNNRKQAISDDRIIQEHI